MAHVESALPAMIGLKAHSRWSVLTGRDPSVIGRRWAQIEAHGAATVFQCREWIEALYAAMPTEAGEPVIVVVDDSEGRCAMVLPLVVAREGTRRVVRFADFGVSDYNAPMLGPAAPKTARAMRGLWAAVCRALPAADIVRFDKMPARIGRAANPMLWLGAGLSSQTQSACSLEGPGEAAPIPAKFRDKMMDKLRRLEKRAAVSFDNIADPAEIEAVFDALVRQKSERAAQLGWDNIVDDPVWQRFYRGIARGAAQGGVARLFALKVDGEPVAIILGFLKDGRFHDVLATFAAGKWKSYSIGLLVQVLCMDWMKRHGVAIYDMTIGAEGYKDEYAPVTEPLYEICTPLSLRGWGPALATRGKWHVRANPRVADMARRWLFATPVSPAAATHWFSHSPLGAVTVVL